MKVVFIASLAFSGSTLLDMMLSCHPKMIGIGEVDQLIDPERRTRHIDTFSDVQCTCGELMENCVIWKPYREYILSLDHEDYAKKYKAMMDIVREQYGDDVVLVDSSKYVKPLSNLLDCYQDAGVKPEDFTVLHLMKDVRGFVLSHKRNDNLGGWGEVKMMRKWHRTNMNLEQLHNSHSGPKMQIGYEEICLYPEYAAKMICETIGVEYDPAMIDLKKSHGHQALGNMMRLDPKKSKKIYYDNRWFAESSIHWKYLLHPGVRAYNESRVYKNTIAKQKGARFQPQ